jgi:S1-C subfamily serine protease
MAREKAVASMISTFETESRGGDPAKALTMFDSIQELKASDASRGLLPESWGAGLDRAALVDKLAQKAEAAGQVLAGRIIRGQMPAPADEVPFRERMQSMVKGVCTIWVNKGMKIEQNVGVPDRVIGSGFFIDGDGYLLTNYHVIASEVDPDYEGYSRLYIRLPSLKDERIPARVVGWDRNLDLALLKAPIKPEYVFTLDPQTSFEPGDRIYAIGSPVGLESSVTAGIVSATGREILPLGDSLQVDVAVNPGNSGGPLLDENGRVGGIVFAGLLEYQGLNFAVHSKWIIDALPGLYAGGEYSRAYLGLSGIEAEGKIEIDYVVSGTGADEAGLKPGDIILSVDGHAFKTLIEIRAYTMGLKAGRLSLLRIKRAGMETERFVDLRPRPFKPLERSIARQSRELLFPVLFGMEVERATEDLFYKSYRISRVYPGGVADEAGLSVDDPFVLREWRYDKALDAVLIQIYVKRQKQGFLETIIQLPVPLQAPNFF